MTDILPIPTHQLDVQGEHCPYPALNMLKAMQDLASNDILEVISDCAQALNNIPHDAKNHGYEVLKIDQQGPILRFYIKK